LMYIYGLRSCMTAASTTAGNQHLWWSQFGDMVIPYSLRDDPLDLRPVQLQLDATFAQV
jgi:hypothetical protein